MNSLFVVLFIFAPAQMSALKLLTSESALAGESVLEDDDEEWESDIEFSFKPFTGKCKTGTAGTGAIEPTSGGGKYAGSGEMTTQHCAAADQKAADFAKYCTNAPNKAGANGFKAILLLWETYLKKEEKFAKCPHYVAKLASMGNKKLDPALQMKSFDIDMTTCATVFYKENAESGTTKHNANADLTYRCYTFAGITWAKNDPKVRNMDGEEFEIMATGTFSMLKLETSSLRTELEVMATIDRAGTRCGATYIQNISLTGQWVEDVGVPRIQIKAAAVLPKAKALQVKFDKEWQHADSQWPYAAVQKASPRRFTLKLHKVTVMVSVDSHRIHENGVKTHRFANFLNVNFAGIGSLSNLSVRGLLGSDPHGAVETIPEGCGSTNLKSSEEDTSMFSIVDVE